VYYSSQEKWLNLNLHLIVYIGLSINRLKYFLLKIYLLFFCLVATENSWAQGDNEEITCEIYPRILHENGAFGIELKVPKGKKKAYESLKKSLVFPEISGCLKWRTLFFEEKEQHIIVQTYLPSEAGSFELPAFTLFRQKGESFRSPPATITIKPGKAPGEAFPIAWSVGPKGDIQLIKESEHLPTVSWQMNKRSIMQREGILLSLVLHTSIVEGDYAYPNIDMQLTALRRKLTGLNGLLFDLEADFPRADTIDGPDGPILAYTLYSAAYYPFDSTHFEFPSIEWEVVRYSRQYYEESIEWIPNVRRIKVAKQKIQVTPLPPHPLKGSVPVGTFTIYTQNPKRGIREDQVGNAYVSIRGSGNPYLLERKELKGEWGQLSTIVWQPRLYAENGVLQAEVNGQLQFEPSNLGTFISDKDLFWVYFNTNRRVYDTLFVQASWKVQKGKDLKATEEDNWRNPWEKHIENASSESTPLYPDDMRRYFVNLGIIILVGAAAFLLFKK
jgi:hypothetical protein